MLTLCKKCGIIMGLLLLVAALAFLLKDLGIFNFWNINWWTVALAWLGLGYLVQANCDACQDILKK